MSNTDTHQNIEFACKHCGKNMLARPEKAGRTVHCIKCHCAVRIPRPGVLPEAVPATRAAVMAGGGADETAVGIPAAFETRVMPAIVEWSPEVWKLETPADSKATIGRVGWPIRVGMAVAAGLIVALVVTLKSAGGPRGAVASEVEQAPATLPGK